MLDRTRSFGTISGQSNYAYEQDGKYFNARGEEIVEPKEVKEVEALPAAEEVPVAEAPPVIPHGRLSMKKHYESRFGDGS